MAGEATVGSIVAYLRLDRSDWDEQLRRAAAQADELGRHSPTIRIRVVTDRDGGLGGLARDTAAAGAAADGAKFKFNLLADSIALIGPAAIPVTAVAGGAMLGLLPIAGAAVLGITQITKSFKTGAYNGTQFGSTVNALSAEFKTLQTTSASGILAGLTVALQSSTRLFGPLNTMMATASTQLGMIAAHAIPAVMGAVTQLSPLFSTFGNLLIAGAGHFEHWVSTSSGIKTFMAYVQANLPNVVTLFGGLFTTLGHVVGGLAQFGSGVLGMIGMLLRFTSWITSSSAAMSVLLPLLTAGYVAFRAYQGITAIMASVTAATALTGTAAYAASLATQAAVAQEASAVAAAKAVEAAAARDAAIVIATAAEENILVLDNEATVAAEAAIVFADAMAAEADAAAAAAVTIGASATAAARVVVTEGEVASIGWRAMLGPIGAIVIGLSFLWGALSNTKQKTQDAAAAMDLYAESVKKSTDALSLSNLEQTNANLSKDGALAKLKQLSDANTSLGVSFGQLTLAVNGSDQQFNDVIAKLDAVQKAGSTFERGSGAGSVTVLNSQAKAAKSLITTLTSLRGGLGDAIRSQLLWIEAQKQSQIIAEGGNSAVAAQAKMMGVSTDAYLAAQQAAKKNTDATAAQTLAFQLENNAAGLVNQALATMAGQNLSVSQSQTSLDSATLSMIDTLKKNNATMAENTAGGVADRQAIEGATSALRGRMTAEAAAGTSTVTVTKHYREGSAALLDQIGRLHGTTSAAYLYAKQILAIPPVAPTKVDLQKAAAEANRRNWLKGLSDIPPAKFTRVDLETHQAAQNARDFIALWNSFQDKTITLTWVTQTTAGAAATRAGGPGRATGGYIAGPGSGTSDSAGAYNLSNGEFVVTAAATSRYRAMLESINAGQPGVNLPVRTTPLHQGGDGVHRGPVSLSAATIAAIGDRFDQSLNTQTTRAQTFARTAR